MFDTTKSSSWTYKNMYQLNAEVNLGYEGNNINGTYGFDTLGIVGAAPVANVSVENQVVADMITESFYLGNLGLNAAPITFSLNDSAPSLLTSLKGQNSIPSLSFGYTAGAFYKGGGVDGSLTLGGYDASRLTPNDVSFTFAPAKQRQLVASVQSITYSDSKGQQPLLSAGILALVDSTVPYLWLPVSACTAFEKTFGIVWDPIANLYLVNDTTHTSLVKSNPSVIFQVSNSLSGGPSVNITFPYASFDLNASYPLVKQNQRYFPLQRAADDASYTLGRTFFQEAFMIVDFERSNFSISQAVYDAKTPSHVVAIQPTSSPGSTGPSSTGPAVPSSNGGSHGLAGGAIAGIVVALILAALIAAGISFYCLRRRRKNRKDVAELPGNGPTAEKPLYMSDTKASTFSQDDSPQKNQSTPAITINQVPVTPPLSPPLSGIGITEYFRPDSPGSPLKPLELPGSPAPSRSEIDSPARPSTPRLAEMPSPEPGALRSELSTPEPLYPEQELPTPDPSHELATTNSQRTSRNAAASRIASSQAMPSSAISGPADGSASDSENDFEANAALSALNSPRLPIQRPRPPSVRMDSSDSEAPFTRDGLPPRSLSVQGNFRRVKSSSSDLPTAASNFAARRPAVRRQDTNSSDQSDVSALSPQLPPSTSRPQFVRSFPAGSASFVAVRPPLHQRIGSADSDTWETRLELTSASEGEAPDGEARRGMGLQHRRAVSEQVNGDNNGGAGVASQQQNGIGHRRAVSQEEQRVREGLVGGGVLNEEPEVHASGALQQ